MPTLSPFQKRVSAWPRTDEPDTVDACIRGPPGTPFEGGEFRLEIVLTERYPFEPPRARFITPVYHPNIDTEGRICLDTLKMPPKGSWGPAISLTALLTTIRLLLAMPNPDDGLMPDISRQYQVNPSEFDRVARAWTSTHAMRGGLADAASAASGSNASGALAENLSSKDTATPASSAASASAAAPTESDMKTSATPAQSTSTAASMDTPPQATEASVGNNVTAASASLMFPSAAPFAARSSKLFSLKRARSDA